MASISTNTATWRGVAVPLAGIVILADALFWEARAGLSLVVFAAALVAAVAVQARRLPAGVPVLLVLGALPVIEHVQALSLAFLAAATAGAIAWLRLPEGPAAGRAAATARLLSRLPLGGIPATAVLLRGLRPLGGDPVPMRQGLRGAVQAWGLPVGGTVIFATLMADANPLIARAFSLEVEWARLAGRALFWCGVALVCLPLVDRAPLSPDLPRGPALRLPDLGVNAASTLRALVLFNAVIGLQTGLDLSVFGGSAELPPGITHAAYAHRGAYPLLATALLAGAFALLAQPYLGSHRLIRPLMLLWLAQNVALCLSAMLRLDLYVAAFGLTYMRIHAMVWMGLVAAGLALTGWQVARGRSRGWLLLRTGAMGVTVLYACCFVNFAHVIAARNLSLADTDRAYLCSLGPTAAGAFVDAGIDLREAPSGTPRPCGLDRLFSTGWRDWEFRSWRVWRTINADKGLAG